MKANRYKTDLQVLLAFSCAFVFISLAAGWWQIFWCTAAYAVLIGIALIPRKH